MGKEMWAELNPELVQRIGSEHEVASHGYEVFDLTKVSNAAVVGDLEHADGVISAITGRTTRPLWSASAAYRDARVNGIAANLGYRPIFWTADSGDWTFEATADGVRPIGITGHRFSADALREAGALATVDEVGELPSVVGAL